MTFWKVSENKMNCLITKEEIEALGYTIEDLMQNKERTKEFLNLLLEKGSEILEMKIDGSVTSFYGAFMPDRSLLLSISYGEEERPNMPQESIPKELIAGNEDGTLSYQIMFDDMDQMIDFCSAYGSGRASGSRLYENNEIYYLMMDFENTEEGRSAAHSIVTAEEFGGMVEQNVISELFLNEHERCLIKECAVEKLCEMDS